MGFEADHLRDDLVSKRSVYVFEVGGFTASTWTVVDDFNLNDFFF